ncbi:hypothetical protein ACFL5E_04185 [Candidatus Omnitrophota bacterium]
MANINGYGRLATEYINSDRSKEAEAAFVEGLIFGEFERINAPKNGQGRLSQARAGALALPWRNGAFFEGEYGGWYSSGGWDGFHALPDTFKPLGGTTGWFCTEPIEEISWEEINWDHVRDRLPEGVTFSEGQKDLMEDEYNAKKKLLTIGAWDEMQVAEDYMLGFLGWLYGFNISSFYTLTPEDPTATTGLTMNTRALQTSRWNKGYIIGLVVLATKPSVLREVWKRKGFFGMITFLVSTLSSAIHPLLFRVARALTLFWCVYFLPIAGGIWVLLKLAPGHLMALENETGIMTALSGLKNWIGEVVPQVINFDPTGWGWLLGASIVFIPLALHKYFTIASMFRGILKKLNLKRQDEEIAEEYIEPTQKMSVRETMDKVNGGLLKGALKDSLVAGCLMDAQMKMTQLEGEERIMLELWGRVRGMLEELPSDMDEKRAKETIITKLRKADSVARKVKKGNEEIGEFDYVMDVENFKLLWPHIQRLEDGTYSLSDNVRFSALTVNAMAEVWKKVRRGEELARDEEWTKMLLDLFLIRDVEYLYKHFPRDKLISLTREEFREGLRPMHKNRIYSLLDGDENLVDQLSIRMYIRLSQENYFTLDLFEMYMNMHGRHAEVTDEATIQAMAELWGRLAAAAQTPIEVAPGVVGYESIASIASHLEDPNDRMLYKILEPFITETMDKDYEYLTGEFIVDNVSDEKGESDELSWKEYLEYYTDDEIRQNIEGIADDDLVRVLSRSGRRVLRGSTPAEIREFVRDRGGADLRENLIESATKRTVTKMKELLKAAPAEQLRVRIAAEASKYKDAISSRKAYNGSDHEKVWDAARTYLKRSGDWQIAQDIKERTVDEFKLMRKAIVKGDLTVEGLIGKPEQTFVTRIIGYFFPEMKTVTLSLIAPKLWLFWAGTIISSVLALVFLPAMPVWALIPVWGGTAFAGGLLATFVVMAIAHRYISSAHGEDRAVRALSVRLAMPNFFIDCYQTLYLYGNKVAWQEVISGSRVGYWWLTGRTAGVQDIVLAKNAEAFYPDKFKPAKDSVTEKRLKLQTIWNWGFMVALYHIIALGLRSDLTDVVFSKITNTINFWSSLLANNPARIYIAAGLMFIALIAGIVLIAKWAINTVNSWKKSEFSVTLGLPADIYDELTDMNVNMKRLSERTGVTNFVRIASEDENDKIEELKEKTQGEKTILALLDATDLPVDEDTLDINFTELEKIMRSFAQKATEDIVELMHPEITKLDPETIIRIGNIDQLRNITRIMARILPEGKCLDLKDKSIYDIRVDNIYNMHSDVYSENALRHLESLKRWENAQNERRYFVTVVDKAMDLKLLGNSIRERREAMEITDPAADPIRDIVIVRNELVGHNVGAALEATGLGEYITADSVITIAENETLNAGGILAKIEEKTGEKPEPKQVAVGTKTGIVQIDLENPGEILSAGNDNSMLLVKLEDGLVSQLYKMMIEIAANNDQMVTRARNELTQVQGYKVYIYLPEMEKIDLEAEMKNYERYISEILVRA